jgi:sugar O-acyltransferase (sialic acid O-acetyltransferase NeuD family)
MLLYGAGGHAKVIVSCIDSKISGIFDDDPFKISFQNIPVIQGYTANKYPEESLLICIGNNQHRQAISAIIQHKFATVAHHSAWIDSSASVQPGTVVLHRAVIQAAVTIGAHVIINTAASIDHDCVLGDFVHIGPGAIVCGQVTIQSGTFVGAGTIITPGVSIGKNCLIYAGSVISKNIPNHTVVKGNPAQIIRPRYE